MTSPANHAADRRTVFMFPGQGSYSYAVLRDLYVSYPQTLPYFHRANEISRHFINGDFLSLVTAASEKEHDDRLKGCPDLDQVGIYLIEALTAKILIESGVRPDLVAGHSFGELAALATAGVYSIETGIKIVCQRILTLQAQAEPGAMAALSCNRDRAKECIEELGNNSLETSVINHPRQTVVSGKRSELEGLAGLLGSQRISLTVLKSRYPYHSSLLKQAVSPFRTCLKAHEFSPASIPAYLSMEGKLYSPDCDLAEALTTQLVRVLDFRAAVKALYDAGYRKFVECGAGDICTKLVGQNLTEMKDVVALPVMAIDGSLKDGLKKLLDQGYAHPGTVLWEGVVSQLAATSQRSAQLLESMSLAVRDVSRMLERTGLSVEPGSGPIVRESAASAVDRPAHSAETVGPALSDGTPRAVSSEVRHTPVEATVAERPERESMSVAEDCPDVPIAIVGYGCVLPGAYTPEQYWSNIVNGISGISNLTDHDAAATRDFIAGNDGGHITVVPDKTYTLLHGNIASVPYDAELLSPRYSQAEFVSLTKGQKLLALALAQSLDKVKSPINPNGSGRVRCVLGATADGSKEYDEAVFLESLEAILATLDEPQTLRQEFTDTLESILGYKNGDSEKLVQHRIYSQVVEKLLGGGISTYVVDTACSSSLYSIYLGMKALQDHELDIALAGGVFAPGPANNTLFAQFRGLTPRESRPFDASADGVVFSDGAGIVILKRLSDAFSAGDSILAVIRGMGLSSDGKSPSINVPQVRGQNLAIRRAYERSGIDLKTVQYVEAHATATLVGDAVEFSALKDAMKRDAALPRIELGSVKALVGHTGWAAGIASVIKICKAFEARVVPRQYNYVMPSPEIDLDHSPFNISQVSHPWNANIAPYPRRAAINGFGFGGTNAHLILEDFDEGYHRNLSSQLKVRPRVPVSLAVVSVGSLFPDAAGAVGCTPSSQLQFKRDLLRLPKTKMLLPDVTDHMDASQYLAALAAESSFSGMPDGWARFKDAMGVTLGLASKTERGSRANERIFADRLRRQFSEHQENGKLANSDLERILAKLLERVRTRNIPSGPYTLPGLMPNVTAGRIANMFDLNGPNIVVDSGGDSLLEALFIARQLLTHEDCKIVLAGGINADNVNDGRHAESAMLLAVTTPETARQEGLPVICILDLVQSVAQVPMHEQIAEINPGLNYKGAGGTPEILKAIRQVQEKRSTCCYVRHEGSRSSSKGIVFAPTRSPEELSPPKETVPREDSPSTYAYIQGTPIRYYAPHLVPAPASGVAKTLHDRRLLFVTDQPEHWLAIERSGVLAPLNYKVVCPPDARLANSVPVDLRSEESIQTSLSNGATVDFDVVIAVRNLQGSDRTALLLHGCWKERTWLDLLFAVCRHHYEKIYSEHISVVALNLDAYSDGELNPHTGLISGFMKSLSRELNGPLCRVINSDEGNLLKALRLAEIELGHPASEVEVCYRGGKRSTFALAQLPSLTRDDQPYLNSESVVIATGGARGVTAVLVEELLRRFSCRVIALGRTDPSSAPLRVQDMDERAFKEYETQFYKEELARGKVRKITDLKQEYMAYRAANEVSQINQRTQAAAFGKYEYRSVDITDEQAVDKVVEQAYRQYGRVDLVLHGAGVQVSKNITRKSLSDFRKIVATKLDGLRNLYKACEKRRNGHLIHFHILTSVFSYMGNDGQPDYGAANEALSRIVAAMASQNSGAIWSCMAWLGWAGIGMTRDSEFAALAAARRLRGVTRGEGQQIFAAMMKGTPASPVNVLLADGEIEYYRVAIDAPMAEVQPVPSPVATRKDSLVAEHEITIERAPYLLNHLVDGTPTLPGAFIIALVGEAALELRPELKIVAFEKANFRRFIRVYQNRTTRIRVHARVTSEDDREAAVHVRFLSDFIHSSGVILQKDVLQHEIVVKMSAGLPVAPKCLDQDRIEGQRLADPYLMNESPVCLSGPFKTMRNIVGDGTHRRADYRLNDSDRSSVEYESLLPKIVLMDSLWRFGAIQMATDNSLPVFVPEECAVMKIYFDFAGADAAPLKGKVTFSGTNPRSVGDRLCIGPVAASDDRGSTLLVVEGGVCRRFGEVRSDHAL